MSRRGRLPILLALRRQQANSVETDGDSVMAVADAAADWIPRPGLGIEIDVIEGREGEGKEA